ncbi:Archaeal ATPase [Stieleria maiorica]|uniref:Archaeal ATPase n=1 Tax=Stieleria maiorica TaxID=2795974 RepID=A0A5B9MQU1_9BACT|nr:hypothetical protein [Stieleria maiorica]QEG02621.1 Archaeal ATPase [Stieleria maiorica]
MNPFSYGGIVGNGAFCNRARELGDLRETMKSAGRCFVYAERRMGKTSLILRALNKLPKKQFVPVYVDLWPTDGSAAFSRREQADRPTDDRRAMCSDRGHPFYTQHLCHIVWSMTDQGNAVTGNAFESAITELLRRESHAYVNLWESLTKNEQRFLRGLAQSELPPKPFSSDFTRRFGLRRASNAQRAAESLESSDLIEREEASFVIIDRFLRLWIRQLFSR